MTEPQEVPQNQSHQKLPLPLIVTYKGASPAEKEAIFQEHEARIEVVQSLKRSMVPMGHYVEQIRAQNGCEDKRQEAIDMYVECEEGIKRFEELQRFMTIPELSSAMEVLREQQRLILEKLIEIMKK